MNRLNLLSDAVRFAIGGVINTALSYIVFLLLLKITDYQIAYAGSWVFGILFVVIFYPSKVFVGSSNSLKKITLTIVQYILVFISGLCLMSILIEKLNVSEKIAIIIVIVFTTAINFLLMRLVFRKLI